MVTPIRNTNIRIPQEPFLDDTGMPSRAWYIWLQAPNIVSADIANPLSVQSGGTQVSTAPTNGEVLIGANGTYKLNNLTGGEGVEIVNGDGSITIDNTGLLSITAGKGIAVDKSTGDVTIENTGVLSIIAGDGISVDQSTGDVTVVNEGVLTFSGGTTGLTPATPTVGDITLAGTLAVTNGGTGQTSYTNGQLLIGNSTGNTLTKSTLTAGTGISITNGAGSITIAATSTSTADQENQTATANQTVFTLTTMTYTPGSNTLSVFIDGINQQLTTAYAETNSTTVTFTAGLHVGAKVRFATV